MVFPPFHSYIYSSQDSHDFYRTVVPAVFGGIDLSYVMYCDFSQCIIM